MATPVVNTNMPKQGALYILRDGCEYVLSDPELYLIGRDEVVLVLASEMVLPTEGEPVLVRVTVFLPRLGTVHSGTHHVSLNWDERWRQLC